MNGKSFFTIFMSMIILISFGSVCYAEKKVVLYTAHASEIIETLKPIFEAETGIKAEVVKMGSSDIIRRVVAEKERPQADVIWSIGGSMLEANYSVLEPFTSPEMKHLDPAFFIGKNWLPYSGILMVFVVNTDLLDENNIPLSWKALAKPMYKGMISSARADKSGSSFIQLNTVLAAYGKKGWNQYKSILTNFALSGSSGAVPRFVNDGEASVGLTLEDNAYRYVKGGGPVKIIYPVEGTALLADGIALIKNAPNPREGKAFINWALSKKTQKLIAEKIGRRPVRSDIKADAGLLPLSEINFVKYDLKATARNKKQIIQKWKKMVIELEL
jgi:iron(III) transport system substrate-binding protein